METQRSTHEFLLSLVGLSAELSRSVCSPALPYFLLYQGDSHFYTLEARFGVDRPSPRLHADRLHSVQCLGAREASRTIRDADVRLGRPREFELHCNSSVECHCCLYDVSVHADVGVQAVTANLLHLTGSSFQGSLVTCIGTTHTFIHSIVHRNLFFVDLVLCSLSWSSHSSATCLYGSAQVHFPVHVRKFALAPRANVLESIGCMQNEHERTVNAFLGTRTWVHRLVGSLWGTIRSSRHLRFYGAFPSWSQMANTLSHISPPFLRDLCQEDMSYGKTTLRRGRSPRCGCCCTGGCASASASCYAVVATPIADFLWFSDWRPQYLGHLPGQLVRALLRICQITVCFVSHKR